MRAKIISKSNYRYYYNIRFVDLDRPDADIYLRPGEFWSRSQPVRRSHHEEVGDHGDLEDVEEVL